MKARLFIRKYYRSYKFVINHVLLIHTLMIKFGQLRDIFIYSRGRATTFQMRFNVTENTLQALLVVL